MFRWLGSPPVPCQSGSVNLHDARGQVSFFHEAEACWTKTRWGPFVSVITACSRCLAWERRAQRRPVRRGISRHLVLTPKRIGSGEPPKAAPSVFAQTVPAHTKGSSIFSDPMVRQQPFPSAPISHPGPAGRLLTCDSCSPSIRGDRLSAQALELATPQGV